MDREMESGRDLHLPTLQGRATHPGQLWYFSSLAKCSQPGQSSCEDLKGEGEKKKPERGGCI